jgi:predicted transcriptional regulator
MDGIASSQEKWGADAISAGFTVVPNHLIAINQFVDQAKRLSPTEMLVVLQILQAWWAKDRLPFPSKATIASRAGLSPRQVQRALTSLEAKEYIQRVKRFAANQGRTSNQYDLDGLVRTVMAVAARNPTAFKGSLRSIPQETNTSG